MIVDVREAMRPFALDQEHLLAEIEALLPRERVEVVRYPGCPSEGTEDREIRFRPPQKGAAVLMLTDLGVGPRLPGMAVARPADWRRFARRLRRGGCSVAAFVPHAPRRVPASLRRVIAVLPWRAQTTSGEVGRLRVRVDRRAPE